MSVDRIAIVTGASRGIGAATARKLAADGIEVGLVARTTDAVQQLAAEIEAAGGRAHALPCDLTDREALAALVDEIRERWGRLDVLINNAGLLPTARRLERTSWKDWDQVVGINLAAPWFLSCRARELMDRGGVIVNVGSTAGYYPSLGLGTYNITKAAVVMLTRATATEWASAGIRVVGIAPGVTDTAMAVPISEYYESMGQAPNPMNRLASPDEIADLIHYVAGARAAFITGSVFTIDGGELLATAVR